MAKCKICEHDERRIIEAHIIEGTSLRRIAEKFKIKSKGSVSYHRDNHMGRKKTPDVIPATKLADPALSTFIEDSAFEVRKAMKQLHIFAVSSVELVNKYAKKIIHKLETDPDFEKSYDIKELVWILKELNTMSNRTLETIQKSTALQVMSELSGETEKTVQFQIGEYQKKDKKQ